MTSDAIIPSDLAAGLTLTTRQTGVVARLDVAALAFRLVDPKIEIKVRRPDGSKLAPAEVIASVRGPARGLLTAERTALNFLCHLSGIATATAALVEAVRGHKARIVGTRKTTPGVRALEKHAVRAGGGCNHRFGLDDAILIKDNHIAIAGRICAAVERARPALAKLVREIGAGARPDAVLLDNIALDDLGRAVKMLACRAITEASGRITAETAAVVAATGVDLISVGWITHSAPILDIGLDFEAAV